MDKITHKYTEETLQHYVCAECSRYWSMSDHKKPDDYKACPHCGICLQAEKKEAYPNDK